MKKIEVRSEKEARDRRVKIIIGIIIVALMVFSTLGYAILEMGSNSADQGSMEYNSYKFVQTDTGWQTILASFNNKALNTHYLPGDVLNYSGTGADLFYFSGKTMYFVASSENDIQASYDFLVNLNDVVSRVQFACSYENENSTFCQSSNLPLKDCGDANYNSIIVKIDSNSSVSEYALNNSCLSLSGQGTDFIKMTDNFIFKVFKVIE